MPTSVETLSGRTNDRFDSMTLQILLREQYDADFRIYDAPGMEGMAQRPLGSIAHSPKEDTGEFSGLYKMIYRYSFHDIGGKFKLSLTEFLDLPRDIVEMLFKVAMIDSVRRAAAIENATRGLEE